MSKFLFINLWFLPLLVYGEVKVRSFIQPLAISPQDTLTLTVEVEYESSAEINKPRLPHLNEFQLISQSQSHQLHIINGQRTHKKQYQYTLKPQKEGKFRIDPIEIVVNGQVYKTTPPKEIEVSSKIKPKPPSQPRLLPFGFGKKGWSPFFSDPFFREHEVDEKDIFLKLKVNKTKAYVNEMILAEWFFYFPIGGNPFKSEVTKSPALNGFWVESLFQLGQRAPVQPERAEIKGQSYLKQKLIAKALFPIQTGNLTIGPLKAQNWPSNFALFRGPLVKPILKESQAQDIHVIPLPKEGRGDFWTSAVGDFLVSAKLNKDIVSTTEPVVYKVHFEGKGHPRWIHLPTLDFGPDWTVYDITESQQFSFSKSHKTYEVILLPQKSGDLLIPSFELSTFDSGLGVYKTHVLPSLKLKVRGVVLPKTNINKTEKYFSKEEDKTQELKPSASRPLKLWVKKKPNILFKNRKIIWLSIYGLLIICFILSLSKMLFFQNQKDSVLSLEFKSSLNQADRAIKKEDWKKASQALLQAMFDFFSSLLEQDTTVKHCSVLLQKLPLSIRIKYEKPIRSLVFKLESLSFAPAEETTDLQNKKTLLKLRKALLEMINKINKDYKKD